MPMSIRERAMGKGKKEEYVRIPEPIKEIKPEEKDKLKEFIKKHPKIHEIAEDIRKFFGIKGETPAERIKYILGGLHKLLTEEIEKKRREWTEWGKEGKEGYVPEEKKVITRTIALPTVPTTPIRPELEAKCEKVFVASGEAFDIGDIEGIRIGDDVFITIPSGKQVYLITRGRGIISTSAKKLSEIV